MALFAKSLGPLQVQGPLVSGGFQVLKGSQGRSLPQRAAQVADVSRFKGEGVHSRDVSRNRSFNLERLSYLKLWGHLVCTLWFLMNKPVATFGRHRTAG